jgi:hypothetical protein
MPYFRVGNARTKLLREIRYWAPIAPKYMRGVNLHVLNQSELRVLRNALREIALAKQTGQFTPSQSYETQA